MKWKLFRVTLLNGKKFVVKSPNALRVAANYPGFKHIQQTTVPKQKDKNK